MAINPKQEHNHLLAALSSAVQERLVPELELVELEFGRVIYHPGQVMTHAYFPVDCILSTLNHMDDGETTEIAIIGNDGFVDTTLLLGAETTPNRTVVQSAGRACRLTRQAIKAEFERHGEAYELFLRHVQLTLARTAQSVLCNRHHSVEQQLCRWLLASVDRVRGNTLRMTQQLIPRVLGVRREEATDAIGMLQSVGLISCQRGVITVLDRAAIERRCCECYEVIKREGRRVLNQPAPELKTG